MMIGKKIEKQTNIKPIEFHAQLDNMDMKMDDESGQDNGDDDNLFHLSPEHTRHTQRSMNEKPTIMSLRFFLYISTNNKNSRNGGGYKVKTSEICIIPGVLWPPLYGSYMLSRPRLGVNTWELFHSERYLEETSTRKSHNDLGIATNSGRGKSRHLLRPTVNFGIIVATLKDTQLRKLHDAIPVLNRIIKEGKVRIAQSGITGTIQRWLGLEPADFIIDASVLLFSPLPVHPGANSSENNFKINYGTKILSDVDPFESIRELHHQILWMLECVAISLVTKEQYPYFIFEFEVGGVQVHKDFAVVVAEAAHALSRILSTHTFSETKISLIRVHFALVNNFHIYVLCFELQSGCIGADIENVLNLIVYLRQIDCKDGLYLRNLLSRRTSGKKREFYCGLSRLPSEAEKSRVSKVNFTPKAKRIRYEMCSTEDKRNDSAYYYGNYPVLLEEENVNQQVIDLFLTGSSSMKISNLLN
ncbi:unnamed protein product [Rhizophagus irregularis]|nr:unnamed protein product [Rhizophagus irregularis]